jgi:hemerythrin-like metal-binding protein
MHSLHDPQLDRDHDLVITLFEALCHLTDWTPEGRKANRLLVQELLHDVSAHSRREESLMKRLGYPGLAKHVQAHREMAQQLEHLIGPMLTGSLGVAEELALLRQLFLAHIVTFDEAFGEWLSSRETKRLNSAAS